MARKNNRTPIGARRSIKPDPDVLFNQSAGTAKKIDETSAIKVANSDIQKETAVTEIIQPPLKDKSPSQPKIKLEKSQTETKPSTSSKKKSVKNKAEPKNEMSDKEELVKTTVYIEEDNFLALEDIQLKLKRKEKRRVTKNELFNTAIELLIKHYDD